MRRGGGIECGGGCREPRSASGECCWNVAGPRAGEGARAGEGGDSRAGRGVARGCVGARRGPHARGAAPLTRTPPFGYGLATVWLRLSTLSITKVPLTNASIASWRRRRLALRRRGRREQASSPSRVPPMVPNRPSIVRSVAASRRANAAGSPSPSPGADFRPVPVPVPIARRCRVLHPAHSPRFTRRCRAAMLVRLPRAGGAERGSADVDDIDVVAVVVVRVRVAGRFRAFRPGRLGATPNRR